MTMTENATSKKNIAIIIVAAGSSSRLGQAKQLVKHNNVSLLQKATMLACQLNDKVICILGYQAEVIRQEVSHLNVNCLVNENWQQGMGTSIALGIKNLDDTTDGALILLCDQWALTRVDLSGLIDCWQSQPSKIAASCFENDDVMIIGSPAIFPLSYFRELTSLTNTGAQSLIKDNLDVITYSLKNAQFDLDTQEDLHLLNATAC